MSVLLVNLQQQVCKVFCCIILHLLKLQTLLRLYVSLSAHIVWFKPLNIPTTLCEIMWVASPDAHTHTN
jgi:hypothetical protein